jgi:hypothetical protein
MNLKNHQLTINSILIAISTSIIATILHETAHYFAAKILNLNSELHHNYTKLLSSTNEKELMLIAASGPLFSLLLGIILLYISIKLIKPSLLKLFTLWFGMNNLVVLFGYILIAPFVKNGDTGRVFSYFKIPFFISLLIAITSFYILIKLFKSLSKEFFYYKSTEHFNQIEISKKIFLYPIFFSIVINTILNLPVVNWFSLMPTIFIPLTYLSSMNSYKKLNITNSKITINSISLPLIILTILSILCFRILV